MINRRASFVCFIVICLTALFYFGCGGGGGENGPTLEYGPTLKIEWSYPASLDNVRGFRLYWEGYEICNTETFPPLTMNCDISGLDIVFPATFTMTAYDNNFNESPHSGPFTVNEAPVQ